MLALTRKKDEAIIVNGNIEIRILDIQDGKVRIGIEAPKDVTIHREEVYLEIQESNKGAVADPKEILKNITKIL